MAVAGFVFLVVVAGTAVSAHPERFTFPEIARGNAGSRIVSGWEAEEGQIPFQLSLRMVNEIGTVTACGGSIIHSNWGLTAAHCTATRVTIVIRAGGVNLTNPEILFETTRYHNHPDYIDALVNLVQPNDISLLEFPFSLTFSDLVRPIRMQRGSDMNRSYSGVRLVASGWGLTWTQGTSPENMNWVFLSGVTNQACFLAFGGSSIIQDSTICASGYNVTSQSTCQGDSGGPLTVIDDDNLLSQIGVASFVSATGCHTELPAGFIRPGHYHDWYYEVTGINFDWELETTTMEPTTETTTPEPTTETTTPEPTTETTTPEPTTETTTPEPTTETTTPEPATETTTPEPTTEKTTPEPTTETTTLEPTTETTTPEPTTETTTAEPTTETTTPEPTTEITTLEPTTETTTPEPNTETTTPEPTTETTTPEPTTETTTPEVTTPEPTTEITIPEPTTEATIPEPTTEATTPEPESVEIVYPTTAGPESSESQETEEIVVVYPTTAGLESQETEEIIVVYPTTAGPASSESQETEEIIVVYPTTAGRESSESYQSEEVEVVYPQTETMKVQKKK